MSLHRPSSGRITDETLRLARGGDEAAREAVARAALRLALRTARAVTRSATEADDIAQEVGTSVMRQIRVAPPSPAFEAWVHRITVRTSMRALTRSRTRRLREVRLSDQAWDAMAGDHGAPGIGAAPELLASMRRLTPRERIAVVLRYVHDLSEAEVAAALDCRPGAAATMLSRARARLRAHLNEQGVAVDDLLEPVT